MIELNQDRLVVSFPEVHPRARLEIDFQRTLRIPDDGRDYYLPPGFGRFPLAHLDDHATRVPATWRRHGGVMMPMHQSEAMWILFDGAYVEDREATYPMAVKVATGKVNAVTGRRWRRGLHRSQDYLVVPEQPWLDGYCVEKGVIRQFVAMPLGAGYSAEEQRTGRAEHGGLQLQVYPMRREVFERRFPKVPLRRRLSRASEPLYSCAESSFSMGLAPGGRMRQEIYEDPFDLSDWDTDHFSRCFVHLADARAWRTLTGHEAPPTPCTAAEYARHGLPWFDFHGTGVALGGSAILAGLKSILDLGLEKGESPLPENEGAEEKVVVHLGPRPVREGRF